MERELPNWREWVKNPEPKKAPRGDKQRILSPEKQALVMALNDEKWLKLKALATEIAGYTQSSPSLIKHESLLSIFMAMSAIVIKSVREGEVEGIQIAVAGADVFAGAIETAHEMHPEKLRNLGERVSHLAVLISPETVKVEECDERKRVRKFLEEVGVGMKSDDATGRKVYPTTHWKKLAKMALSEIESARAARANFAEPFLQSLTAKNRSKYRSVPALENLPPLSTATRSIWWTLVRPMIEEYWKKDPELDEESLKLAKSDEETPQIYRIRKVKEAFYRLAMEQD